MKKISKHNIPPLYRWVLISCFLGALVAVLFWPTPIHMSSMIYGYEGDSTGSIYDLWTQTAHGLRIWGNYEVVERGIPYGYTANYWPYLTSSLLLIPGVILANFVGPIVAYNLLILSGMLATGLATVAVVRRLTASWKISLWGGIVFMLLPFHQLSATAWYSQVHLETLPLTVLCVLRLDEKMSRIRIIQLVGVLVIAGLSNAYVGLFCFTTFFLMSPLLLRNTFGKICNLDRRRFFTYLTLILFGMFALVVLRNQVSSSISRSKDELSIYGLRIRELVYLPNLNTLLRNKIPTNDPAYYHGSNVIEVSQYLGWITMILGLLGICYGLSIRKLRRFSVVFVIVLIGGFWIGASQGLKVLGVSLPVPAELINSVAPFWRVYSRFGIVVGLAMVLLASLGLKFLISLIKNEIASGFLVAVIIGCSLVELYSPLPGRYTVLSEPSYVDVLDSKNPNSVLLYPIVDDIDAYSYSQNFWQMYHEIPIVNGGPVSSRQGRMLQAFRNISSPHISDFFGSIDVEYIVLDLLKYKQAMGQDPTITDQNLVTIFEDKNYKILRSLNKNTKAIGWYEGTVFNPELNQNGETWRWLGREFSIVVRVRLEGCYKVLFNLPSPDSNQKFQVKPPNQSATIEIESGYSRHLVTQFSKGTNVITFRGDSVGKSISSTDQRNVMVYGSDVFVENLANSHCPLHAPQTTD